MILEHLKKIISSFSANPHEIHDAEATREYYQKIIDIMPNNVYWVDRDCKMLGCNRNTLKLVKLNSLDEFIGKTYEELEKIAGWKEGQALSFKHDDMEVMASDEPKFNVEEPPLYNEKGEPIYYMSSRVPLHDKNNKVIGIVGISVDITERKKMEMALLKAKEEAEQANFTKTIFMENMSHDFKTPLNGIYGVLQIMAMRSHELPDDLKDLIDVQEKSILRLKKLIDSILDFDKLYSGKIKFEEEELNLLDIIESIVHNLSFLVKEKDVNLIINYPAALPQHFIGDSYCMTSIILNLMNNAVKFTEHGHVSITVGMLQQQGENAIVTFSIEDTGIGIPPDKLQEIFERFHRLEPSNTGLKEGHGIGLAAVKELVEKLHGTIEVQSELGKGSIFTVTLPIKVQEMTIYLSNWQIQHPNVRILMACDQKTATDVFLHQLGQDAIKKVGSKAVISELLRASQTKSPFSILIVDDEIQSIDPLELIKAIQHITEIPPVMSLLSTKPANKKWFDDARIAGFFDFIIKPVLPSELNEKISHAWERWNKRPK